MSCACLFTAVFTRAPPRYEYVNTIHDDDVLSVMDALNVLGNCPWIINAPLLSHVEKVYREGGNFHLDIPESEEKLKRRSVIGYYGDTNTVCIGVMLHHNLIV